MEGLHVFDENSEVVHEELVLFGEMKRLFVAAGIAKHLDGHLDIEVDSGVIGVDKLVELLLLFELRVAVDQQRGVLAIREASLVQRLQIRGQLRHSLRVEELFDHVGGLDKPDRLLVLLDGLVVLVLVVQIIAVSTLEPSSIQKATCDECSARR